MDPYSVQTHQWTTNTAPNTNSHRGKWSGPAECAERLNPPPQGSPWERGVLNQKSSSPTQSQISTSNLHFQSPFPISSSNLHFQSPLEISISNLHCKSQLQISISNPPQFPISVSIRKSFAKRFARDFQRDLQVPLLLGGEPPLPPSGRAHSARSTILMAISVHFSSKIADQLFRRGPWDLFGRQTLILKPPRTLQKPQKMKNKTFKINAECTSKIDLV